MLVKSHAANCNNAGDLGTRAIVSAHPNHTRGAEHGQVSNADCRTLDVVTYLDRSQLQRRPVMGKL